MSYIIKAIIPIIIISIVTYGVLKGVKVYECFVEGSKEGIKVCFRIFPYLLAMLLAVGVFRESKAMDYFVKLINPITKLVDMPPEIVPLVLIKPLSGSGAIGVFTDIINKCGPDTYTGRIASIIMGSTETIFYVVTVYFGSVGIKKMRHTVWAAVFADLTSILMAIIIVKVFFY